RLDIWLDVACLFRTRSEAQKACKSGKIDVNGQTAKPNRLLRVGDELVIGRPYGRKQRVAVRGLADRHVAKPQARQLYEDLTPACLWCPSTSRRSTSPSRSFRPRTSNPLLSSRRR